MIYINGRQYSNVYVRWRALTCATENAYERARVVACRANSRCLGGGGGRGGDGDSLALICCAEWASAQPASQREPSKLWVEDTRSCVKRCCASSLYEKIVCLCVCIFVACSLCEMRAFRRQRACTRADIDGSSRRRGALALRR